MIVFGSGPKDRSTNLVPNTAPENRWCNLSMLRGW